MTKILANALTVLVLLVSQQLCAETVVPVDQEPHHHIVFQNKYVRIFDAIVPPGDQTLLHKHTFDNVFVVASGGKGTVEVPGKPLKHIAPVVGVAGYSKAPLTHRVGNVGTTPLRFIVAEVLAASGSKGTPAVLDALPGYKLVLENDRVKVYRVSLEPNQSTGPSPRTLPWLRVSVSQSTISVQDAGRSTQKLETKPGDYRWYGGATNQSLKNVGATPYKAIEIEWK